MDEQVDYDAWFHRDHENSATYGDLTGSLFVQAMTQEGSQGDCVDAIPVADFPADSNLTSVGILSNHISFNGATNWGSEWDPPPLFQRTFPCNGQISQDHSSTNHLISSQNPDHDGFAGCQRGTLFNYMPGLFESNSLHPYGPVIIQEEQQGLIGSPYDSTQPQDLLDSSSCTENGYPIPQGFELRESSNINIPVRANSSRGETSVGSYPFVCLR